MVEVVVLDVLLGCVGFDWKDAKGHYGATSKRAKEKRELVNFAEGRLGLTSGESLSLETSLAKRTAPSRFTAWRHGWEK